LWHLRFFHKDSHSKNAKNCKIPNVIFSLRVNPWRLMQIVIFSKN
jgi:hypothetical protein